VPAQVIAAKRMVENSSILLIGSLADCNILSISSPSHNLQIGRSANFVVEKLQMVFKIARNLFNPRFRVLWVEISVCMLGPERVAGGLI
jgi:hypothetical protein